MHTQTALPATEIASLVATVQQHIAEIDRDLAATYITNRPFCVVLEDTSMGIAYNELEGVTEKEPYYILSTRPSACLRFSRASADELASQWNSDPKRPRVKVMGHVQFYEEMRKIKTSILNAFADVIPLAE